MWLGVPVLAIRGQAGRVGWHRIMLILRERWLVGSLNRVLEPAARRKRRVALRPAAASGTGVKWDARSYTRTSGIHVDAWTWATRCNFASLCYNYDFDIWYLIIRWYSNNATLHELKLLWKVKTQTNIVWIIFFMFHYTIKNFSIQQEREKWIAYIMTSISICYMYIYRNLSTIWIFIHDIEICNCETRW